MSQPKRIQRQRKKGWKLPENAVYVGRPGKYGNPFRVGDSVGSVPHWVVADAGYWACSPLEPITPGMAVDFYRVWLRRRIAVSANFRKQLRMLRGFDLACWCKPGDICHADVLLELVNQED